MAREERRRGPFFTFSPRRTTVHNLPSHCRTVKWKTRGPGGLCAWFHLLPLPVSTREPLICLLTFLISGIEVKIPASQDRFQKKTRASCFTLCQAYRRRLEKLTGSSSFIHLYQEQEILYNSTAWKIFRCTIFILSWFA